MVILVGLGAFVVGTAVGFFMASLLVAARRGDEALDAWSRAEGKHGGEPIPDAPE